MDKIEIKITEKNTSFNYAGYLVEVNPIIGIGKMEEFISTYFQYLFETGIDGNWDEQFAEFMLRRHVIEYQTNIDMSKISEVSQLDEIIWGGLYTRIQESIYNYDDFRSILSLSFQNKVKKYEIENSVGKVTSGIILYVKETIDAFKNMNSDDIEKMKGEVSSLIEQVKTSPISGIVEESKKDKKPRKKKEYVQ